jgi:type IV fimbrial biogenesis protein FimT
MLLARPAGDSVYLLQAQNSRRKITFNSRGAPGLASADQFNLIYDSVGHSMTTKYGFNICLDGLGRTRTIPQDKTCATY